MLDKKIAIIGAGNMGLAIARGLLSYKAVKKNQIFLTDSKTKNNRETVKKTDIVIIAVKPKVLASVLEDIRELALDKLIISIVAGVKISTIEKFLGHTSIIRAMPNLAAAVGKSVTGWVKNSCVNNNQIVMAKEIFESIGEEIELSDESYIDRFTVISGCGPGYIFYITEILEREARKLGFSKEISEKLSRNTIIGSAKLLVNSKKSAEELRVEVSSKGGMTEAAIKEFDKGNLRKILSNGVFVALKRAYELNKNS